MSTATAPGTAEPTTTVYDVAGMTCGHCRGAVTAEVSALPGVTAVEVDLAAGTVAVTAAGAGPDDRAVAAAVDEAGYELTGRAAAPAAAGS